METSRRLLVVDDEPANGRLVEAVAREVGYEVQLTDNARDFKGAFATFRPSVVMLDLVMPDTDGIEVVNWLAAQSTSVRVIIATGFDPTYAKAAAMIGKKKGLTIAGVLIKPFGLDDLRAALA